MPFSQKSASKIQARLQQKIRQFLLKEQNPTALLYFLMFAYYHIPFEIHQNQHEELLFVVAVIFAVAFNFNFVFMMVSFLNASIIFAVPMLAITLLFSNDKWKVYLLILSIGDKIFVEMPQYYFLATFSLLICCHIHSDLIFNRVRDNIEYFMGMVGVSSFYLIIIICTNFNLKISLEIRILFVMVLVYLAHQYFCLHVKKLRKMNPDDIKSDRIMAHYLCLLENQISDPICSKIIIHSHTKQCRNQYCFCNSQEYGNQTEYFMRQLYQNAIQRFSDHSTDCLLYENYVDFLLRKQQMINALHFLSKWQPIGFFSLVGRERILGKVQKLLKETNSSNLYQLQYKYALEYDKHYKWMAEEINSILKLKLQFWGEVSKQSPRAIRMKKLGSQIITRMYDLNVFYNLVIKEQEKSLFLFDTTALYAMYILSSTNFKDYGELIVKKTAKVLQEVYSFESRVSETYVIQTAVRQQQKHHIDHPSLQPLLNIDQQDTVMRQLSNRNNCKLVIDSISRGLCQILQIPKNCLLGRELNTIIPDGYKQVHNIRLSYLLDVGSDQTLKQIVPSQILHKEVKLPVKGANGQMAMAYVTIKFVVDLQKGLTFISVVKLAHDKCRHALMDFSGEVTECQDRFNKTILQHKEVKRYLQRIKEVWQKQQIIREQSFNLIINKANCTINISSPLIGIFLEKQNLNKRSPPIHIEIINEEFSSRRTIENDRYNKIGKQIKYMQKEIEKTNSSPDSDSSNASVTGNSFAIMAIFNFADKRSVPIYRFLQLIFFVMILGCLLANFSSFLIAQLPWDVTQPQNNPLNDTMNMYALHMLTIKALNIVNDEKIFINSQSSLNQTQILRYFGYSNSVQDSRDLGIKLESSFKDVLWNCLKTPSDLLNSVLVDIFSTQINVLNPVNFSQIINATDSQNLTYLEILMIYATDFNLMTSFQINHLILSFSYTASISNRQNVTFLSSIIDESVHRQQAISVIVHLASIIFIILLLIPLQAFLKKRLALHEKLYDLIASIDAQQVAFEMKSLSYICDVLRNYKKSNQIMKMNIIEYEERSIHSMALNKLSPDNYISFEKKQDGNREKVIKKYTPSTDTQRKSLQIQTISKRLSQLSSQIQGNPMSTIQNGFKSMINERMGNYRKRPGQLDRSGSIFDPQKKVISHHCLLYLLVIPFSIILGVNFFFQHKFNSSYLLGKNELLKVYENQIIFQLDFLTTRVFFMEGPTFFANFMGVSDAMMFLYPTLNQLPIYNYYDGSTLYSEVISNCSLNSNFSQFFLAKYCQYDYSQVVLRGQFGALFKELVEMRYLIQLDTNNPNFTDINNNITEKLFYLQSLNFQLEQIVLWKVNHIFDTISQLGQDYLENKFVVMMVGVLFAMICGIGGAGIIMNMKDQYFREVYLLTLLSNQMFTKNKRVESFIDLIAKNSSL